MATAPAFVAPILAIDPGLRVNGMAIFSPTGRLLRAGLATSTCKPPVRGPIAWQASAKAAKNWYYSKDSEGERVFGDPAFVLVEGQMINFERTRDPNDVLQCNGSAGALTMVFPDATLINIERPEHWKGSLPKATMTERIKQRIESSPEEFRRIEPCVASLYHNVLDAIGIGLWHFGRLQARKVIAR